MLRYVLTLLILLAAVYLALCALLFFFQRSLIYFPQPRTLVSGTHTLQLASEAGSVLVTVRRRPGAQALLTHFPQGLARLAIIPGQDHNSISEGAAYVPLLRGGR